MMSSTSNASAAQPTVFLGDDFSNNLFSDLAPLLTLFGEQVTKQFLSLSMGWADSFLLAMAPIGIMTVVVSAIRVGGARQLKAIVGRARESKATAEAELLSSTSENVCELWNGNEIVRAVGEPRTKVFVIRKYSDQSFRVFNLKEVIKASDYVSDDSLKQITWSFWSRKWRWKTTIEQVMKKTVDPEDWENSGLIDFLAPNITLNVKGAVVSPIESWMSVIVGLLVQGTVLTMSAFVAYSWKWKKSGRSVSGYGYPCFLLGTIGIAVGLVLCSHVIEGSTTEKTFRPRFNSQIPNWRVVRLQRECIVNEQHFGSYCISNSEDDPTVHISRLNQKQYNVVATLGTLISVVGFIVQFVGLRALHWSTTIMQLGATLIMTTLRTWIRRGLSKEPIAIPVPSAHELSWLSLHICGLKTFGPLVGVYESDKEYNMRNPNQTIQELLEKQFQPNYLQILNSKPPVFVSDPPLGYFPLKSYGHVPAVDAVIVRGHLQRLVAETSATYDLAIRLAMAIERTLGFLTSEAQVQWRSSLDHRHFHWYMRSVLQHSQASQGSPAIRGGISSEFKKGTVMDRLAQWMRCRGSRSKINRFDENIPYKSKDLKFSVKLKHQGGAERKPHWCIDRTMLDSLLSLWSLSLGYHEETEKSIALARGDFLMSDQYNPNTAFELGRRDVLMSRQYDRNTEFSRRSEMHFVRIISSETLESSDWSTRWIGRGIRTFPVGSPDGVHLATGGFKNHPVFGIELSSIRRNSAGSSSVASTSPSRIQRLWQDLVQVGPDESYDSYMAALESYRLAAEEKSETAVGSSRSVEEECAFEIFSSFMLSIADRLTGIGGLTRELKRPAEYDLLHSDVVRRPEEKLWANSVIDSMARVFVESGLGNELEAYTLIVPALKAKALLPTQLSAQPDDSSHESFGPGAPSLDSPANPPRNSSKTRRSISISKPQSQSINSSNNRDDTIAHPS